MLPVLFLARFPGASSAQVGAVLRAQKIDEVVGGFSGPLHHYDFFGEDLAALGDLDGDGIGDLAVGATGDDDGGLNRGAIWILFLNANGTVKSETKISQTQGGFGGTLPDGALLGWKLANVGDLDGDGAPELAVISLHGTRLWILFLRRDGTVKSQTLNLFSDPVFVPPAQARDFFYGGLTALGDLDGDGLGDLAIGAPTDPDGGPDTGAIWIVRLKADGTLKAAQKISQTHGGFSGTLPSGGYFGIGIVPLGDLDGDGNLELGVASGFYDLPGDFWVLHLDANELVSSQTRFSTADYGLSFPSGTTYGTPEAFSPLVDLDGDGIVELAMEFASDDFPGGPVDEGGFAIAFLRQDGSVRKKVRVSHQLGGLGNLPAGSGFGGPIARLGDLDGDGSLEIAVAATRDQDSGDERGAVWILSLDPDARRNGSGVNPLMLSQASDPVFGSSWTTTLDCSGHASGLAIVWGFDRPTSGVFLGAGEILVTGQRLFQLQVAHLGGPTALSTLVPPPSLSLIDLPIFVQGLCSGAPGARLSNALDVLVGQ